MLKNIAGVEVNLSDLLDRNNDIADVLEIKEKVGRGAYGEVFRAIDRKTGEVFALKRIIEELDKEIENDIINQEAELQAALDHPNIVK